LEKNTEPALANATAKKNLSEGKAKKNTHSPKIRPTSLAPKNCVSGKIQEHVCKIAFANLRYTKLLDEPGSFQSGIGAESSGMLFKALTSQT